MSWQSIYHSDLPSFDYLVWDGRVQPPLYRESPEKYPEHLPDMSTIKAFVIKTGTELFFHRRHKKNTDIFLDCHTQDLVKARVPPYAGSDSYPGYGKGIIWIYSGTKAFGRRARLTNYERIGENELEEWRKDAEAGEPIIKGMIKEYFDRLGQRIEFVDVTPEEYLDNKIRTEILSRCAELMENNILVCMNEMDKVRQQITYEGRTFNENDGLASLTAQGEKELYGPTGMIILTNQRGVRPKSYFEVGKGETEEDRVIRVVKHAEGLESQAATNDLLKSNGRSSGGILTKIKWSYDAARNGVHSWVGNGMYYTFDREYRRGESGVRQFRPVIAVLERKIFGTYFLPSTHPLYSESLAEIETERIPTPV